MGAPLIINPKYLVVASLYHDDNMNVDIESLESTKQKKCPSEKLHQPSKVLLIMAVDDTHRKK